MEERKYTYRVRPCNSFTLDELRIGYLWFSRPTCYKDTEDANIAAFIQDTYAIKKGLLYVGYKEECLNRYIKEMTYMGICCFTKIQPLGSELTHFPRCQKDNAIVIKYKREKLTQFFETHRCYPLYPCFHDVIYDEEPTKLEQFDSWSFLVSKNKFGLKTYKTIPGILHEHPRELDNLLFMLYTRINNKYEAQKEERIIIAGRNVPAHNPETQGYQIAIPTELIDAIYVYPNVKLEYLEKLKNITCISDKIILLET